MEKPNQTDDPVSSNTLDHQIDPQQGDDESTKEIAIRAVDLNTATCSKVSVKSCTLVVSAKTDPHQGDDQSAKEIAKESVAPATGSTFSVKTCTLVSAKTATAGNDDGNPHNGNPHYSNPLNGKPHNGNPPGPIIRISNPSVTQVTPNPQVAEPQRISLFLPALPSHQALRTVPDQPQSLFIQALSKLNESSHNVAAIDNAHASISNGNPNIIISKPDDSLTTPNSLTSAPPSYSFVLRQMAARQRPRLMGTFIPSPSFVNHAPPPNYAAAFDIYVDNSIPPSRPIRVFDFGFTPIPAVCQECGYTGLTVIVSRITLCTHFCAIVLCLCFCWLCAPLPYMMRSCKDVRHYCRSCGHLLGMYSPTHAEPPIPPYR